MPVARIPFWELRRHGVAEELVRALGFDLARPVSVREPAGEDALEFTQEEPRA